MGNKNSSRTVRVSQACMKALVKETSSALKEVADSAMDVGTCAKLSKKRRSHPSWAKCANTTAFYRRCISTRLTGFVVS